MIAQVPELADGRYWYVVPVTTDDEGSSVPAIPAGTAYAQWRNDGVTCVISTKEPVLVLDSGETVSGKLDWTHKPRARFG